MIGFRTKHEQQIRDYATYRGIGLTELYKEFNLGIVEKNELRLAETHEVFNDYLSEVFEFIVYGQEIREHITGELYSSLVYFQFNADNKTITESHNVLFPNFMKAFDELWGFEIDNRPIYLYAYDLFKQFKRSKREYKL